LSGFSNSNAVVAVVGVAAAAVDAGVAAAVAAVHVALSLWPLIVSLVTSIYYLFYYMVTKNPTILFDVHIHGLAGYVAGICVAVRQIMPDHLIFKTRYGRLTNR